MGLSSSAHFKRAALFSQEKVHIGVTARIPSKKSRKCNLCAEEFMTESVFDRYCSSCKQESELLKFSEWLPAVEYEISQKLSA